MNPGTGCCGAAARSSPRTLRETLLRRAPLLLVLLLPWALLWPLPLVSRSALVTSPLSEGVTHLWIWWAAFRGHAPLHATTDLLNYPDGVHVSVIDPMNLVPFALGWALGPAAAFNTVLVWGLAAAAAGLWPLVGLAAGLAMLSKYTGVVLLPLLILADPKALRTRGPWLAAGIAFLVYLPNAQWNYSHNLVSWSTTHYVTTLATLSLLLACSSATVPQDTEGGSSEGTTAAETTQNPTLPTTGGLSLIHI